MVRESTAPTPPLSGGVWSWPLSPSAAARRLGVNVLDLCWQLLDRRDQRGCRRSDPPAFPHGRLPLRQLSRDSSKNASCCKAFARYGLACTVDEWLQAAEYVLREGNPNVVLCERGIRTFEPRTPFTLDLSAVALVKRLSYLPVIVGPESCYGQPRTGRSDDPRRHGRRSRRGHGGPAPQSSHGPLRRSPSTVTNRFRAADGQTHVTAARDRTFHGDCSCSPVLQCQSAS